MLVDDFLIVILAVEDVLCLLQLLFYSVQLSIS